MWVLMNTFCKPSLGMPCHVTKILQAENGQKLRKFEPIYFDNNYRHWWNMVCDFWAHYQPPLFRLCSFTPTWIQVFLFCIFVLTFFFLLLPSTFKLLNAVYSKSYWLILSRRIFVWQKSGVPGILLNWVLQIFQLLNHYSYMDQIFGMGRY